jgi:hypothetical protein
MRNGLATAALAATATVALETVATAGLAGSAAGDAAGAPTHALRLSEIRVDQQGADTDEYFEVSGRPTASLAGIWFLAIGDSGTDPGGVVEAAIDLSAWSLGPNGRLVAREASFGSTMLGGAALSVHADATDAVVGKGDSINLENSDSVTYLLVRQFTGSAGADLDADNDGTLDGTPWAELLDAVAFVRAGAAEPVYASVRVGPVQLSATGGMPPHAWLADDGWRVGEYGSWSADTPGAPPAVPAPGAAAMLAAAGTLAAARPRRRDRGA